MSIRLPFTDIVRDLPATVPFVGPEAQERNTGITFRARLGANESCFGPSPKAIERMRVETTGIWQYGDPENHDLKHAIAKHYKIASENVVVGEGIDGLFGCLAHLFVEPGVQVVTSLGSYPTFNFHIKSRGGALHLVPYKEDHEDLGRLIDKVREEDARLLYVSNPNNPMGNFHSADAINELISNLPSNTVLALDEAYIECAPDGTAANIDVSNPQVLRFRTFSKAYGMAGARVGYAIGHEETVQAFDKVRNHYGMNRVAQFGALEAIKDQAYLAEIRVRIAKGREKIANIAQANGLAPLPSATNFVAIDCGRDSEYAKAVLAGLLERGIFVRMPGVEPQSRCIRVSVGPDEELELFGEVLGQVLKSCD